MIIAVVLAYYRWSLTKEVLKDSPYFKIPFVFIIVSTMQISTNYILSIIGVENIPFIQMLTIYNMCTKLVFYSLLFILISFTIQYLFSVIHLLKKNERILAPILFLPVFYYSNYCTKDPNICGISESISRYFVSLYTFYAPLCTFFVIYDIYLSPFFLK